MFTGISSSNKSGDKSKIILENITWFTLKVIMVKLCSFYVVGVVAICLLHTLVTATLSKKTPKSKSTPKLKTYSGPQDYTVFKKNLVVPNITPRDVIENHAAFFRETDNYNFDGMVLGYVTPWNNHGYDVAKIFGNKFTHISPVWLQMRNLGPKRYEVTGVHDVDKKWMAHVKNAGRERSVKLVPRLMFEGWTLSQFRDLLTKEDEINALLDTLHKVINKWNFNGLVFEFWTQLTRAINSNLLINFVRKIGDNFLQHELDFILVIPPNRGMDLFTADNFQQTYDYVTAYSLMTYDFSSPDNPGPNAPFSWVEDCVKLLTTNKQQRKKILTGLNFYGNDYGSNSKTVLGHDYVELLTTYGGKLVYDTEAEEHYYIYEDSYEKHVVYYPSLYSISKRMNLSQDLGSGLSIWELGQGLDYFYDLF